MARNSIGPRNPRRDILLFASRHHTYNLFQVSLSKVLRGSHLRDVKINPKLGLLRHLLSRFIEKDVNLIKEMPCSLLGF